MPPHIVNGRLEDLLPHLDADDFDAVLCDPPYGFRFMGKRWDYDVPSAALWEQIVRVLKPGAPVLAFGGTRTYHRLVCGMEDAGLEIRDTIAWIYGSGFPKSLNLKDQWQGYGTALKPALEPICVARKPLEGTMAQNVGTHGVGGLNIDGTRIGTEVLPAQKAGQALVGTFEREDMITPERVGRWPANVILDEEAGAVLDAQTGISKSAGGYRGAGGQHGRYNKLGAQPEIGSLGYGDNGGASRFFYCPKANRREREAGCDALPARAGYEAVDREADTAGVQNPRAGAGRTAGQVRNFHPTVKPLDLCRYLATLIKPPKPGKILVPFAGSGSEMIGCLLAGWEDVLGIEQEQSYCDIANARIAHWRNK